MKKLACFMLLFMVTAVHADAPKPKENSSTPDKDRVVATVLGKEIKAKTARNGDELFSAIFLPLVKKFAKDNKIEVTDEDKDKLIQGIKALAKDPKSDFQYEGMLLLKQSLLTTLLKDPTLTVKEQETKKAELQKVEKELEDKWNEYRRRCDVFVLLWKVNQVLYEKHGGRVSFEEVINLPTDAYRDFLKDQLKQGSFEILDKTYEPQLWQSLENEKKRHYCPKGKELETLKPFWIKALDPKTDEKKDDAS
ncbi:MAG: hypothetical protein PVH19_09425 [Planctomycetia bacterium]|jgi:hypothetical protein